MKLEEKNKMIWKEKIEGRKKRITIKFIVSLPALYLYHGLDQKLILIARKKKYL
jgi:hypothetical protein